MKMTQRVREKERKKERERERENGKQQEKGRWIKWQRDKDKKVEERPRGYDINERGREGEKGSKKEGKALNEKDKRQTDRSIYQY